MSHPRTGDIPFNPEEFLKGEAVTGTVSLVTVTCSVSGGPPVEIGTPPLKVHLMLVGETLDPAEISKRLQCMPDEGFPPGTLVSEAAGGFPSGGLWAIRVHSSSLEAAILQLLKRIETWDGSLLGLPGVQRALLHATLLLPSELAVYNLTPKAIAMLAKRELHFRFVLRSKAEGE